MDAEYSANTPMVEAAAERDRLELLAYDLLAALIEQHGLEVVLAVLRYWLLVTTMQEKACTERSECIGKSR